MPIARKTSGTTALDPREAAGRTAVQLLEAALDCYKDAAEARERGDSARADFICESGDRAVAFMNETIEGLAST